MINGLDSERFMSKSTFTRIVSILRLLPSFSMSFGIQRLYKAGSFMNYCQDLNDKSNGSFQMTCSSIKYSFLKECCKATCQLDGSCCDGQNPLTFDDMSGVATEFINLVCDGLAFMLILWLLEGNIQKIYYKYKMRKESKIQSNNLDSSLALQTIQDIDVVNERN